MRQVKEKNHFHIDFSNARAKKGTSTFFALAKKRIPTFRKNGSTEISKNIDAIVYGVK